MLRGACTRRSACVALLNGEGGRPRFARRRLGAVAADWETPKLSRTCPAEFDNEIETFG